MIAASLKIMRPNISNGAGTYVGYSAFYRYGRDIYVNFPPDRQAGDLLLLMSTHNYILPDFLPVAGVGGLYYKIATGSEADFHEYIYSGHPFEFYAESLLAYTSNLMVAFRDVPSISVIGGSGATSNMTNSQFIIPGLTMPAPGMLVALLWGSDTTTYGSNSMTLIANFQDSYSNHVSQAMFYQQSGAYFTGDRLITGNSGQGRSGLLIGLT